MSGCDCDPLAPAMPVVVNPPGQQALHWQVAPHAAALSRMRAKLADDPRPAVRALARHGTDEPAVALLDAWAVVADVVSFYTERIAEEGFLRTATELRSVRELARTLGYELRPGVAADAELAFTVEDGAGVSTEVTVAAGTPVQSVPAQGQLPQTFETSQDLLARAVWNAIPGAGAQPQVFRFEDTEMWLRGVGLGVRAGDPLVVVGLERLRHPATADADRTSRDDERWDFRIVDDVTENPTGLPGWTRLRVHSLRTGTDPVAVEGVAALAFAERANLFGWNAPDPALLRGPGGGPVPDATDSGWNDFGVGDPIELDGDHPRLRGGDFPRVEDCSWLVLEGSGLPSTPPADPAPTPKRELYRVTQAIPGSATRYALSGRITNVQLDVPRGPNGPENFDRRGTAAHCQSHALPAAEAPRTDPVRGATLTLARTDPTLPEGRRVLVTGLQPVATSTSPGAVSTTRPLLCEPATVLCCKVDDGGSTMTVTLDHSLDAEIDPQTLRVLANSVAATHGETVHQVLGSGDGRVPFARFRPSRVPLTYVGAGTASGARSTMDLRVDGVAWTEVASLDTAAGHDRVFTVRHDEDGAVTLGIGDGTHGARASTGVENVTATYRVGIGAAGAAVAGQLSMLPRRPLGVRAVNNPGPAQDWAPPESLEDARRHAPLRIRTLDRAVSVADHEDFAAAFAGVGSARADEVWDGHTGVVVVSLLGTAGTAPGAGLVTNLATALAAARDPGTPLRLLAGELLWFGLRVELRTDPAYERAAVEQAVRDALSARLAPAVRGFVEPVIAAGVLVMVRAVPGVVACTMPRLLPPGPPLPDAEVLAALPARSDGTTVQPAQLLGLAPDEVAIGVMPG